MLRKVPIVAHPITYLNLESGLRFLTKRNWEEQVEEEFKKYFNARHLCFINSGTSACFESLEVLKQKDSGQEVIIPAYTAASIIHSVQKAGLKPVLCDVSLDDFNLDINLLEHLVSENTLSVIGVHMFGVLMNSIEDLKNRFKGVAVIEDGCQSFGSKINGSHRAKNVDISFFSFNRGKNIPTYGGGIFLTDRDDFAAKLKENTKQLQDIFPFEKIGVMIKLAILSIVVNPWVYGLLHPLLLFFKAGLPKADFKVKKYSAYQAGVAISLLKTIDELSRKRYENGMKFIDGVKEVQGVRIPQIAGNTQPAFNHFPIVFEDLNRMARVEKKLWQVGIGTSRMYPEPLHHIFDLGYKREDFPNACYLAKHLLTLPVHPLLKANDIERIIHVIKETK